MNTETVWQFATENFRVCLEVAPEDMAPEDSFEFPEDIEAVRNGDVAWFWATVTVSGPSGEILGRDSLGGCAYRDVAEFYQGHRDRDPMNRNSSIMRAANGDNVSICHYFPSMVREAIREARKTIAARAEVYGDIHA